jgi:hypothetical protein
MHEYNPAKFLMEQLDDELERKYREAQARGDYAEADRIAGQMQQSGPTQSTTALTRSDLEDRMDSMLGGGASAQSTRGASPVSIPQEVPSTQGGGAGAWEALGPDEISRWTNAISMGVGIPLGFTPLSPIGDALDATAAGIHGLRSQMVDDPELSDKLKGEAIASSVAAIPGPAGSLASMSRLTAPAGRLMRSGTGQIGAALAGSAAGSQYYPDETGAEAAVPTGAELASAGEAPDVGAGPDAGMEELERMLQKGNLDLSNMFYTRGVDPWNVGFRRDKPNKRSMMMYAGFDKTVDNIMAAYLTEAAPAGIAAGQRRRRTPQNQPQDDDTQRVGIVGQRRAGKFLKALAPSGALAALAIAGGAPFAISQLFGKDTTELGKSQPLAPQTGGGENALPPTMVDKLQGSLGLVQGFNPALMTINALFRRMGAG